MDRNATWRIAWKEYRTQRPLWVAMAVLALLVQSGYFVVATVRGDAVSEQVLFTIAMGAAVIYALGCGATLFATERETGTFEFQRGLPLDWRSLLVGKAGFGAASVVALAMALWISTIGASGGRSPSWLDSGQLWGGGLLAAWEVFAWSLLFSLLLDRPLIAAVLGIAVPSAIVHLAGPAVAGFDYHSVGLRHYLALVPSRIGIALTISAANVWLASRWLRESGETWDADARPPEDAREADAERISPIAKPGWQSGFWRLVWQQWHQTRWTTVAISLGYISAIALTLRADRPSNWIPISSGWLVPAAALCGVAVFLADQRRQAYRFFAERGIGPRWIWLSRQLVGMAPLAACLAAAVVFWALYPQWELGRTRWPAAQSDSQFAWGAICCVLLAYTAGQACSMFFHSAILALVATAFSVVLLVAWVVLMRAAEISWAWSVLPVPVVLLVATWRRAPDWILERASWPARWRLGSTLAAPAAVLVAAVILFRIDEIPRVAPGLDVDEFLSPPTAEQTETIRLYQLATRDLRIPNTEPTLEGSITERRHWAVQEETRIKQLLEASHRPACPFWNPALGKTRVDGFDIALALLSSSYGQLLDGGRLDEAWERSRAALHLANCLRTRASETTYREGDRIEGYVCDWLPRWAAHSQQTPERIKAAIRELEAISQDVPSAAAIVHNAYVEAVRPLDGDFRRLESEDAKAVRTLRLAYALLPWEVARARRLAGFAAANQLAWLQAVERSLHRRIATPRPRVEFSQPHDWYQFNALMRTTPLARRGFWGLGIAHRWDHQVLQQEMFRRAVRIQLALLAWRHEHERFPEKLDDLAGPYFDQLPRDPWTDRPFRYEPRGWPTDTRWSRTKAVLLLGESPITIPAERPFLWSPGSYANAGWSDSDEPPTVMIQDGSRIPCGYFFAVDSAP
jgi:hypothetical protein